MTNVHDMTEGKNIKRVEEGKTEVAKVLGIIWRAYCDKSLRHGVLTLESSMCNAG